MLPVALERPVVDPELEQLNPIERAGEVLRYSVLRVEYWLSRRGTLREWIRLTFVLAIFAGIPAVVLAPVITGVLTSAVTWSAILADIARNLAMVPAWVGTALLALSGIALLRRLMFGR